MFDLTAKGTAVAIGGRCRHGIKQKRLKSVMINTDTTDTHRPDRIPMIGMFKPDEAASLGLTAMTLILIGHLKGYFHGSRSVIGVEHSG